MDRVVPTVLLGGVVGSVLRWAVGEVGWSTGVTLLVVNTVASGVLGAAVGVWAEREHPTRLALGVGLCGGLSTFSGLAVELAVRLDRGDPLDAFVLAATSLGFGLAAFLGGRGLTT
ncbi:MAG: CrcB family protein [Actinomycetota bacterium]